MVQVPEQPEPAAQVLVASALAEPALVQWELVALREPPGAPLLERQMQPELVALELVALELVALELWGLQVLPESQPLALLVPLVVLKAALLLAPLRVEV